MPLPAVWSAFGASPPVNHPGTVPGAAGPYRDVRANSEQTTATAPVATPGDDVQITGIDGRVRRDIFTARLIQPRPAVSARPEGTVDHPPASAACSNGWRHRRYRLEMLRLVLFCPTAYASGLPKERLYLR